MTTETSSTDAPDTAPDRELWLQVEGIGGSAWLDRDDAADTVPQEKRTEQWSELKRRLSNRAERRSLSALWADWKPLDAPLRWGLAAASGQAVSADLIAASRIAADKALSTKATRSLDVTAAAEGLLDTLARPRLSLRQVAESLCWAYALPPLSQQLDERTWWELLAALQTLHHAAAEQAPSSSPLQLLAAGELGLVLSWRLHDLPSCASCGEAGVAAVFGWLDGADESIDGALCDGGRFARPLLASVLRCQRLLRTGFKKKVGKPRREPIAELATWAAAMTHSDGMSTFSAAEPASVREDVSAQGLLPTAARELNDKAIGRAVEAALGRSRSGGRLAWQVTLPEASMVNDVAKLAVLLPEWDVRRGRIAVDFRSDSCPLQVHAGRPLAVDGTWQVNLLCDGVEQQADGPWESQCEHSDDDVHYLELEQPWTGGLKLQRHILLLRDDRCLMLADAVIQDEETNEDRSSGKSRSRETAAGSLEYIARLPIAKGMLPEPEADTREVILGDNKPRSICLPLALPEWRVGPSPGSFEVAADGSLVLRLKGRGNLFAPCWFDFHRRRFTRPRTWRQLTIADELRIVDASEAVAFRVQFGSEQWFVYRGLAGRRPRTTLGKHLVADFYCGRFDPSDGCLEELIKVDTE